MSLPTTASEAADWLADRKAKTGQDDGLIVPPTARKSRPRTSETVTVQFNLRRNYIVELELPVDMTAREAERLATVIRAYPYPSSDEPSRRRVARHTSRGWYRIEGESRAIRRGDLPPDVVIAR